MALVSANPNRGEASMVVGTMSELMNVVLPFRKVKYHKDFCKKLLGEGIATPADFLLVSKDVFETKLSTHASFNFIELADAISLHQAV